MRASIVPPLGLAVLFAAAGRPAAAQTAQQQDAAERACRTQVASRQHVSESQVTADAGRMVAGLIRVDWSIEGNSGVCQVRDGRVVAYEARTGGGGAFPQPQPTTPGDAGTIRCESRGNQREECAIPAGSSVVLARTLSSSPCVRNRSWGTTRSAVWVAEGCRAEFRVDRSDATPGGGDGADAYVTCESRGSRREECTIPRNASVELYRTLSEANCTEGRTWGTTSTAIWVSDGCRAQFAVYRDGGTGGTGGGLGPATRVTCESRGNQLAECSIPSGSQVRLVRTLSNTACVEGRSWGRDGNVIWVNGGCRGEFEVRSPGSGASARTVRCESRNDRMVECDIPRRSTVQLRRTLSGAPCERDRTWGVRGNRIWVTSGCRAEFTVAPR